MANKKTSSSKMIEEDNMPETDVSKDFINFFIDSLKAAYWSERHVVKIFPKLLKVATASDLKHIFADQLATAQIQLERLEQVFELLGEAARSKKNEAMEDLADDAIDIIEKTEKGSDARDAGLTSAVQKMKSFEIESYEALILLARKAGNEDIISLLEETLSEKNDSHNLLTALVETNANSTEETEDFKEEKGATAIYDSINLTGKKALK